jgi:membrane protein involved in colicin uptake
MKKWMYVISVSILLAVWLAIYFPAIKVTEAREAARQAEIQRQKEADEAHRLMLEKQAQEDAARRAAETARKEAEAEAAAKAKWDAQTAQLQGDIDRTEDSIAKYKKQVADLTTEVADLNATKEKDSLEDFALLKKVELARVHQFDAELEIQRMVDMIAQRASNSVMANPGPLPPTTH